MLTKEVDAYYIVYKGQIFVTDKGKFTWGSTGAAKNAVHAHAYSFIGADSYRYGKERNEKLAKVFEEIKILKVNLSVED